MKSRILSILLVASTAVATGRAQGIPSAREFVKYVYAQYEPPAGVKESDFMGPDFLHELGPTVFSPSLLRLIRHDQRATPKDDIVKLDFDPICACQDFEGIQLTNLTITPTSPNRALAIVSLYPQPNAITIRLNLMQTPQGWRIDDISAPRTPSLRRYLAPDPVPSHQ